MHTLRSLEFPKIQMKLLRNITYSILYFTNLVNVLCVIHLCNGKLEGKEIGNCIFRAIDCFSYSMY